MRLTLRAMLAYMDETGLEPDDAEDIGKRIEASEFATNLMQHTRDCMRKLRLGVPDLVGRGLGGDPNTVAEYLDNQLASERVTEFEKVCLESEKHLAEVAACHQILALVLGQPAQTDDHLRQRLYQVGSPQLAAPPIQAEAVRPVMSSPRPVTPALPRRPKPEVPEYLREPRSRFWPVAALIFIAALATFGGLLLFGPQPLRDRMTALVQGSNEEPTGEQDSTPPPADDSQPPEKLPEDQPVTDDQPPEGQPAEQAVDDGKMPITEDSDAAPADPNADPAADESAEKPVRPVEAATEDDPAAPEAPEPGTPTDSIERPTTAGGTGNPLRPGKPGVASPAKDDDGVPPPIDSQPGELGPGTQRPVEEPAVAEPASFGRYTSKHDVLLKYNPETNLWNRLPAMASLAKGDRLMSLPSFRPIIQLTSNLSLQTEGAASFQLVGWTNQGVPIIEVEFGRLLLLTVGKAGNPLQLKLDDRTVQLTFVQPESTAALEVQRKLRPGMDPEGSLGPLSADLFVTSGLVRLTEDGARAAEDGARLAEDGGAGQEVELEGPLHRTLFTTVQTPGDNDIPKWLTTDSLTSLDRDGQLVLESALAPDKPVALVELCSHRKREVRSLAIRSIAYIGRFEPCLEALNDKDEKNAWSLYIDTLEGAVARSPETAAQIRKSLEKHRAGDAAVLYRMLWGYGGDDLKNGAAGDLVEALNHDSLDVRVLAFHNLQAATGLQLNYHPGDPTGKRSGPAKVWKDRLRNGKLLPKAPGTVTKAPGTVTKAPGTVTKARPSTKSSDKSAK